MAPGQTECLTLTPTPRLARAVKRDQAHARIAAGDQAWRTPEVASLPAWTAGLRRAALAAGLLEAVPIASTQARALWQQVIDTDVFIGEPRVHVLAERAWRTLHEYRLAHPRDWPAALLSDDSNRFRDWVAGFERLCTGHGLIDEWTFAARVPELIASGQLERPARVVLEGFDLPPTPLQLQLLQALARAGTDITGLPEAVRQTSIAPGLDLQRFTHPDEELRAAAAWARARIDADPGQTIAIVVPDLSERRGRVERIFGQVFDPPGFALAERGPAAWHVSLGPALARWPLVADALLLLGLDPARVEQSAAGRALGSPYLAGWAEEAARRAVTEAELMRRAPCQITAFEWTVACRDCGAGRLAAHLESWRATRSGHRDRARPAQWVERFQTELQQLGFGHGRALDSREHQVLQRWHELLEEFASLDVVVAGTLARGQALSMLTERAAATTFRERNPGCPVEILGVDEALGARFDALWITTLDADTWPGATRRDPLIPGPLQAELPSATSDARLANTRRQLAGLLRAAKDPRGSFATGRDEPVRSATALLPTPRITDAPAPRRHEAPTLETIEQDCHAPVLAETHRTRGGTGVLSDQSACPFRAYARRRLNAEALSPPRPGLDAIARGTLVHSALELFWREVDGRAALLALAPDAIATRVQSAAEQALDRLTARYRLLLGPAGRALQLRCTTDALVKWLALERRRDDFTIDALEQEVKMDFAGLGLSGKIDRIDQTPAGTVLIDYKTGRSGRNGWRPEPRIADPQLPAYALAGNAPPDGLAFARLRPEDLRFDGLCRADPGMPGVTALDATRGAWRDCDDWNALLEQWRASLDGLATAFQQGRAEVDPRDGQVCRTCYLHALCRIHERQQSTTAAARQDRDRAGPTGRPAQ